MRKMWMIAALALLALSVSGCANAEHSEGTPSSEESVTTKSVQSTATQERTIGSVSESTDISAESTAESKAAEMPPEVSTSAADKAPLPRESSTTEPAPPKASELSPAVPTDPPTQETEPPAAEEPAEPEFDIQTWIDYAKAYAESVGLRPESSAVDCWDTPISAGAHCSPERDIQSRLNRYSRDEDITDVWIWAELRPDGRYDLYIGYARHQIFYEERTENTVRFFISRRFFNENAEIQTNAIATSGSADVRYHAVRHGNDGIGRRRNRRSISYLLSP